jgi:hypothetical protein
MDSLQGRVPDSASWELLTVRLIPGIVYRKYASVPDRKKKFVLHMNDSGLGRNDQTNGFEKVRAFCLPNFIDIEPCLSAT